MDTLELVDLYECCTRLRWALPRLAVDMGADEKCLSEAYVNLKLLMSEIDTLILKNQRSDCIRG